MTDGMLWLIAADRAMSSPNVELWVGIIDSTGEVEVVLAVDLDTAHRDGLDRPDLGDERGVPSREPATAPFLVHQALALQPKTSSSVLKVMA